MRFCKDQGSGAKILAEFIDDVATFRVRYAMYIYLLYWSGLVLIYCTFSWPWLYSIVSKKGKPFHLWFVNYNLILYKIQHATQQMQVGVSRSSTTIISKRIEADYIADGSGMMTSSHWDMTCHVLPWHDMTLHYMTWHDMTLHDITWHDMTWHDMTWHEGFHG